MGEIGGSTQVTFPAGAVDGRSVVVASVPLDGGFGVVVERTPFHPLDHAWPDQPADTGVLRDAGWEMPVVDCLTGAVRDGELLVGADVPVRRGADGWHWVVVHVVEQEVAEGTEVLLLVDEERRDALSAGHTGCHLMALALNAALAGHWRKDVEADGLGHPDFDKAAIVSSRIVPDGSRDVYRIGKSLRKKGFVADDLAGVEADVNARLAAWVAADAPVRIEVPSPELAARRVWWCELPEGTAGIPCGGTHVRRLGELGGVAARLELDGAELAVTTQTRQMRTVLS
ncbi:metal-dependent hydrolase [Actinomadura parmotrematis]|uniref:Metal-dependent hydrolase n=1 Tax=Actinomadura parmotrematis TaxID=2864039 RepID=A0ABS7FPC9_9ACTN|nr:metal-dependent hydrolase [Actinomadura parmotrematis]MBW8481845.1 metal-dependent hydrolase [Actinomadura parmotrematis]